MSRIPIEPGRVVISRAGRDAGRRFTVIRVDGEYAFLADGGLRKAESPKKKKFRHLAAEKDLYPRIAELLKAGGLPSNAEIRKSLGESRQEPEFDQQGGEDF